MRTKSKVPREKPPADFDEVRRRMIRQNRDLAKNNSTQSLRIRNLELDVSRLLAENLELRNQVLQARNETQLARAAAAREVKQNLQTKLAELSALVEGIEETADNGRSGTVEKKPLEGNWRERQPLSEVMKDSQMPTIVEDKLYPRRTLGAEEIQAIRLSDHSSNESPDLGPPPVATFDYEDPVKPNTTSPLVNKIVPAVAGEEDMLPAEFAVNLETRRKRKVEIKRHSILPQSPAKSEGETSSSILRTGAKRKLADRESEKPIKPPSKGDFTFSRKTPSEENKASKEADTSVRKVNADQQAPASPPKASRKVLGDKSVNQSPRKTSSNREKPTKDKDANKPISLDLPDNASTRTRRTSSIPLPSPPHEVPAPALATTTEEPPATPLEPSDFFSPASSTATESQHQQRGDTPPQPRRAARARAAVSYAEPSLMAKMRRPDAKLVDAVQDPRRQSAEVTKTVRIKREPVEDEVGVWRDVETESAAVESGRGSPQGRIGTRARGVEDGEEDVLRMSVLRHLQNQSVGSPGGSKQQQPSSPAAPLSTLIPASSRSNHMRESTTRGMTQPTNTDAAAKRIHELELYEFKDDSSSSPLADGGGKGVGRVKSHRRHSSVPRDVGLKEEKGSVMRESAEIGRARERVGRRRSMQV